MRLYLSSFRLGDHTDALLKLLGAGRRACVISNALDLISPEIQARNAATVFNQNNAFAQIGIEAFDLDLRDYFGCPERLQEKLSSFDLVWLRGGNAFVLRRAMVLSGFDDAIRPMLHEDAIVYGGFSAGIVVATPTLRGIELMDPSDEVPEGYPSETIWRGLGLVDFSIVPHYRSDHPEAHLAEKAVQYFEAAGMPYRPMIDGEVFIADVSGLKLHSRHR